MPRKMSKTAIRNAGRFTDPEAHIKRVAARQRQRVRDDLSPIERRAADFENGLFQIYNYLGREAFLRDVAMWRSTGSWAGTDGTFDWLWTEYADVPETMRRALIDKTCEP